MNQQVGNCHLADRESRVGGWDAHEELAPLPGWELQECGPRPFLTVWPSVCFSEIHTVYMEGPLQSGVGGGIQILFAALTPSQSGSRNSFLEC